MKSGQVSVPVKVTRFTMIKPNGDPVRKLGYSNSRVTAGPIPSLSLLLLSGPKSLGRQSPLRRQRIWERKPANEGSQAKRCEFTR